MKKILLPNEQDVILSELADAALIFAIRDDRVAGMIVNEDGAGWILRLGGGGGCDGWHKTREKCMRSATTYGYTFCIKLQLSDLEN